MPNPIRLRSRAPDPDHSRVLVRVTPKQAGWRYVAFSVRHIARGDRWRGTTGRTEACVVLLEGECDVRWGSERARLGPRQDVFSGYPHAVYLPPGVTFEIGARSPSVMADCRAPAKGSHSPRVIRPEDCGYECRGGGNATRQIVDIIRPGFPAEHLLICEVFTPGGNWSSYPPHKHDRDNPPVEASLEETYYYRFKDPDAYALQRLYGPGDRGDTMLTVRHGDLVLIKSGYHPFVAAHGYDAYYLNVLAGPRRSMAASDDPRYAHLRAAWPTPDPRVPVVPPPSAANRRMLD